MPFSCKWGEFMNMKKIKMLFLCFGLTLLLMSVGYSLFEESFSISGEVTLGSTGNDGKIEYELEVQLSKWQSGKYEYQYNPFSMTYIGEEVTKSWHMIIDVPDDATLSSCWNVTCKLENGILNLHSGESNSVVNPNTLVPSFGFQMSTSMANYELNVKNVNFYTATKPNPYEVTVTDGVTATYNLSNSWPDGDYTVRQYNFTVSNNSGIDLSDWQLEIEKTFHSTIIGNTWSISYVERDDKFIVSGAASSPRLKDGSQLTFGIEFKSPSGEEFDINILSLFGKGIVLD